MHSILTLHEMVGTGEITRRRGERGAGTGLHVSDRRVLVATPK